MKRILASILLILPLLAGAQSKLSPQMIEDFSQKAAQRYLLPNDSMFGFITEQMSRSGAGGLEIDKTMTELEKDATALEATLKYLYQYSNGNRQQLIANLRAMNVQSNYVFPITTYTVNKYKDQLKALLEEKPGVTFTLPRKVSAPVVAAATPTETVTTTATEGTTATETSTGETTTTSTVAPAGTPAAPAAGEGINWEVRDLFKLNKPADLVNMYGKENIIVQNATDFSGNDIGKAYLVFPDTDNELQIIFSDSGKIISFTRENSQWKSPFGIKPGDPIEKLVKMNGRNFRFNAFEWDNAGIVSNWQGGQLENKGVVILLKAVRSGDSKLYDQVIGDKQLSSDNNTVRKIGVIVDKVMFRTDGI
ncbi:hypothetical protein MKQ68_17850 [Chitinophaga horti]|uniref:DUF4476 domain-containing protein n=1 Tax=Chitinophaga horti TaxID=2920382 RepID=A0ABY6J1C5_9BACT|nr:hypothetical protein [Chitinophaga horti]UYQ91952.1 hypothetical protein MKQ68_17850 [Chitinophaga horti]